MDGKRLWEILYLMMVIVMLSKINVWNVLLCTCLVYRNMVTVTKT